jgi:hypothetical protein
MKLRKVTNQSLRLFLLFSFFSFFSLYLMLLMIGLGSPSVAYASHSSHSSATTTNNATPCDESSCSFTNMDEDQFIFKKDEEDREDKENKKNKKKITEVTDQIQQTQPNEGALAEVVLSDLLGANKVNDHHVTDHEQNNTLEAAEFISSTVAKTTDLLRGLAVDHELIFFVSSHCQHCHRFAEIVQSLADGFGFGVVSFSFDGKGVAQFPQVLPVVADQRASYCQPYLNHSDRAYQQCQFAQEIYRIYYGNATPITPVLFLQNKHTLRFDLLAKGAISRTLLHNRLMQKATASVAVRG